jgi:hypothetical protein
MLRSVGWYLFTEVAGQTVAQIFESMKRQYLTTYAAKYPRKAKNSVTKWGKPEIRN